MTLFGVFGLLACEAYLTGACEFAYGDDEFYCTHEPSEEDCDWGTSNVYHEYDTCKDLGYGAYGDTWLSSPLGPSYPGSYGAYAGGGAGGGGTGGGTCAYYNDQNPYFGDIQLDSFCWEAGLYRTCGEHGYADQTCDILQGMLDCCYSGSGSCPYCN